MDLRDRVLARYKTGADEGPLGNEAPPMDQSGLPPVTGASELPGGGGGPGKRNIPKDHPYDPRSLKPLSQMLWAMSVSLGHALTAYRKFTRLKSSTISPDGMLGGRGYVMQVKEIRDKLHDACENLSAISDTIHDEINAPHWEPKMGELDPNEALDVRKFIQESQQILQNPEEDAEEEMEAIEDSTNAAPGEGAEVPGQPGAEMQPGAEPGEEGAGEETEGVSPEDEEAFNQDQEGAGAAPEGEETPEGEEVPEGEEAPEEADEEEGDEDEAPEEEDQSFGQGEDVEAPTETEGEEPDEGDEEEEDDEEFPGYEAEGDEEEPSEDEEEEDDEFPTEEEGDEEESPDDEEDDEEDDDESEDDEAITPEDEALAEEAIQSSGLPGASEPTPKPLGNPKKKKKRMKVAPPTAVQDAKFSPEMAPKLASYAYDRSANSSVNPDSLGGPRVHHLDRADAPGQFNSENDDQPTDEWALNDGRPPSDDMSFIWRAAEDNSIEQWWDGMSPENQSGTATFLKLLSNDRSKWTSDDWEKVITHQASSGMPEDTDTHTDGYDFGLGYGAKGDGAGDYANPSGEGNGYQGVYGPTSGLPSDSAAKTENDSTSKIDVELNNRNSQNSIMPTDVAPPAARSDYYTEGLSDEMIAQSEIPTPDHNPYINDRDLPNTSVMFEDHNTPYVRYDYTTPNYRPDPNYSRPER